MNEARTKLQLFFILILFLFSFPPLSAAEDELMMESGPMGEEMMLFQEIPSVYGASKYEQKVTEAPSSVSIITADEIKKYGYRNFAEILRSIRGFYTTSDRNYHYVGVRGFGLPADYNNRVLVLVDGHSINDNIYDAPGIGTAFPLDIDLIERVEVIRGPSSSLYGTSAFFAVVNVITKRGRDYKGLEVSGDAGSLDTYKARLSYGNKFQNGLEMLLSGTYYDTNGDTKLYYPEFDDPATNNGKAQGLDWDRYWNAFGEFVFHDFTLQADYHYRKKGVPTAPWGTEFNEGVNTVDEQAYIDLKYEHAFASNLSVLARISYNYYEYYGDYPYFWGPPDPDIVINKDGAEGGWIEGEVQLMKTLLDKHKVTVGGEYQYNFKQDQYNEDEGIGVNLDDERDLNNWGVYVQDEFTITEKLILNVGVRYDDYDSFGDTTNPRAALIYNPLEKTTFKAVYGRAFRAPSVYELYYNDGDFTQKANPDLDPETIDTYELIYEQYIGDHLRGTIVGFYYDIDDLITQVTDPADGLLVFENVEEVEAVGVEFELEGKWEGGLTGRISYSFQETENKTTDKILPNSPKHLAKLNLTIPLFREKIFFGIEEQYTSERKTFSRNDSDDFFLTNLTLYTRNLLKGLEVSASIYNLFDREYGDPGGEEHVQDTIDQDGLTFRFKATYIF